MTVADIIKEGGPALSAVHANRPLGASRPTVPVGLDLGPGRPLKDIEDEIKAHGAAQGGFAKGKPEPRSLYVSRPLLNGSDVVAWAKKAGFETTLQPDDMHVTVVYSKEPVDWMKAGDCSWTSDAKGELTVGPGGPRQLAQFGPPDDPCAVLLFASSELGWRNGHLRDIGCSSDWPEYQPHVTISKNIGGLDLAQIEPYQGKLVFGPEHFQPVKEKAMDSMVEKAFSSFFKVSGVDDGLGLVFGWGIVCKDGGVDYVDTQGNHIPEDAMVEATSDFMKSARVHGDMHERGTTPQLTAGMVVHSFPLTTEIAKAMGISTQKTGWMVATAPDSAMLAKFKSGEYSGFSIGGEHLEIDGQPVGAAA